MADTTTNLKDAIIRYGDRKVSIMRAPKIKYPELWLEVFILGDNSEQVAFAEMFAQARCTKADNLKSADIVIFTGGDDVNPALYGEERHSSVFFDSCRDEEDIEAYMTCLEEGIPMVGICRGAQFLHVMNGGKLYQHVDGHVGDHSMFDHKNKKVVHNISSVHHQMVIKNDNMDVLGTSHGATIRWENNKTKVEGSKADVEAFFYRDTCCLGFQGHPEYRGYSEYMNWCLQQIESYITHNPDLEMASISSNGKGIKFLRMKADVLEQRTLDWDRLNAVAEKV